MEFLFPILVVLFKHVNDECNCVLFLSSAKCNHGEILFFTCDIRAD